MPRSLRSVAGAPKYGAQETAGHSGRDDRKPKRGLPRKAGPTNAAQEHRQEWRCQ